MWNPKNALPWAEMALKEIGLTVGAWTLVKESPWSAIWRGDSSTGGVFCKSTPPQLSLESRILQELHLLGCSVPEVIACSPNRRHFLMFEAGRSLRSLFTEKWDGDLALRAIETFTTAQITLIPYAQRFLDLGLPQWDLQGLFDSYNALLSDRALLETEGIDAITQSRYQSEALAVKGLLEELFSYDIPLTPLVQPDFNDNNTVWDNQARKVVLIDLGENVVSHPFFSLLNWLAKIRELGYVRNGDLEDRAMRDACLKPYERWESPQRLDQAWAAAMRAEALFSALCQVRLIKACSAEPIQALQGGRLRRTLEELSQTISSKGMPARPLTQP